MDMHRTITPAETRQLFEFCARKGVKYYDVQVELVDHLASAIEGQWAENPELEFEEALKCCYKKFGVSGFNKLIEQKRKSIILKNRKLIWNFILEFFKWPKIILSVCLTSIIYLILKSINVLWMDIFYFSIVASFITFAFVIYFKFRYGISRKSKILLFEQIYKLENNSISFNLLIIGCIYCPIPELHANHPLQLKGWILVSISFVIVFMGVLVYAEYYYIQKKGIQYIKNMYLGYSLNQ